MNQIHIRWMIRRDYPECLAIEAVSFTDPWIEDDFIRLLRLRHVIGMIVEDNDKHSRSYEKIVAFMLYELKKTSLQFLNLAVAPQFRRLHVGQQLVDKLKSKLSSHRRTKIKVSVIESNMTGLLFFKSQGFTATKLIRNPEGDGEDAIRMEYVHPAEMAFPPVNTNEESV